MTDPISKLNPEKSLGIGDAAAWVVLIANVTLAVEVCAPILPAQSSMTTNGPAIEVTRPGLTICLRLIFNQLLASCPALVHCNCSL
jgi:hypothetical protein